MTATRKPGRAPRHYNLSLDTAAKIEQWVARSRVISNRRVSHSALVEAAVKQFLQRYPEPSPPTPAGWSPLARPAEEYPPVDTPPTGPPKRTPRTFRLPDTLLADLERRARERSESLNTTITQTALVENAIGLHLRRMPPYKPAQSI